MIKILDVIASKLTRKHKAVMRAFKLRPGMWVIRGVEVGILKSLQELSTNPDPHGVVMFVDGAGLNDHEEVIPLSSLTQADWKHIPALRRPERELGAALGYR